jgi:hypothetical protein
MSALPTDALTALGLTVRTRQRATRSPTYHWVETGDFAALTVGKLFRHQSGWLLDVTISDADAPPLTREQLIAIAELLRWLNENR